MTVPGTALLAMPYPGAPAAARLWLALPARERDELRAELGRPGLPVILRSISRLGTVTR